MKYTRLIVILLFIFSSKLIYGQWTFGLSGSFQKYPNTFFIPTEVESISYDTENKLKGSVNLFAQIKPNDYLTLEIGTSYANRSYEFNSSKYQTTYLKGHYIDVFVGLHSSIISKKTFDLNFSLDAGVGIPLQKSNETELNLSTNLYNYTPFLGLTLPFSYNSSFAPNKH